MALSKKGRLGCAVIPFFGAFLTFAGTHYLIDRVPQLQALKARHLPALSRQLAYDLPTAQEPSPVAPIRKPQQISNVRSTLEDQVAELLITRTQNIGEHFPGGVLLTKEDTRDGHLLGRYSSYDPRATQAAVQRIIDAAARAQKRVLIFDEGEGGYVMRVGTLPAASDIGAYYERNTITGTMIGRVEPNPRQGERTAAVRELFTAYARELHDRGVDCALGPVLDVVPQSHTDNLLERDGRSFSNSHRTTRKIAALYIDAMHAQGIRVTGKHFLTAGLLEDEDIHTTEAVNTRRMQPKRWAGHTYRVLREDLDAVMVSHVGNPVDGGRPYSISPRAIDYLMNPSADRNRRGVDFDGLVITDDLSMGGLLGYLEHAGLTPHEQKLIAGCETPEARAAVLSLYAGSHAVIALKADTDALVRGITHAYLIDPEFRARVDYARAQYARFAEGMR